MSGGSLDYFCYTLEEHAHDLGDKELNDLVKDLAKLFHDREWFLSGDTGEGSWNEARDAFKAKWFTEHGRQERIEKYLAEFEDEVRKTFGMSKRYCGYCGHWTEGKKDSPYGHCEFEKHCLMHRSECCDRWEESNDAAHSRWIEHHFTIECSKCHTEFSDEVMSCEQYGWFWERCPKCGADMTEVIEGEP